MGLGHFADLPGRRIAIHFGHVHVHEDHDGIAVGQAIERFLAVADLYHFEAHPAQYFGDQQHIDRIVVGHHDRAGLGYFFNIGQGGVQEIVLHILFE